MQGVLGNNTRKLRGVSSRASHQVPIVHRGLLIMIIGPHINLQLHVGHLRPVNKWEI